MLNQVRKKTRIHITLHNFPLGPLATKGIGHAPTGAKGDISLG
jgi:hypothetical protein